MEIKEKKFDDRILKLYSEIKEKCNKEFTGLTIVNNIYLIFQKLLENKDKKGTYVECGVFKGGVLVPVVNFINSEIGMDNWNIIGADTFKGFPPSIEYNKNDLPTKFIELYNNKLISEDHFNKAKNRTNNFIDISHLKTEYFDENFNSLFNFCDEKDVLLLKGKFEDSLVDFDQDIDILYIDCDLYESYLQCFNMLYKNIVNGGSIIFDEYYSHKYPGARIAVNEFFEDKKGYFEKYITPEGFERWCFMKG